MLLVCLIVCLAVLAVALVGIGVLLLSARRAALDAQVRSLEERFASLASDLILRRQQDLVVGNAENLKGLFADLKGKLDEYKLEVKESRNRAETSVTKMEENVRQLQDFATKAQEFTAALVGGNKIQGNRGELILASILEQCGFQEGREYDSQIGLRSDEGRPDVCVYDAQNKHIIFIDAKMNIKDFIEAYNLPDDTDAHRREKRAALRKHVTSIRKQIDNLAGKRYAETIRSPREGYANLPVVAMFCPFNAVLEAALAEDPALMQYAAEKNVVLVTPTTIWGYLCLIMSGWKRVAVEKKIEDIQALGGTVVEKVEALLQDIQTIADALKKASTACESLQKRAGETGQTSIRRVAQQLLDYGALPKKEPKLVR